MTSYHTTKQYQQNQQHLDFASGTSSYIEHRTSSPHINLHHHSSTIITHQSSSSYNNHHHHHQSSTIVIPHSLTSSSTPPSSPSAIWDLGMDSEEIGILQELAALGDFGVSLHICSKLTLDFQTSHLSRLSRCPRNLMASRTTQLNLPQNSPSPLSQQALLYALRGLAPAISDEANARDNT